VAHRIDGKEAGALVGSFADLPCWAVERGYGTVLNFHFGRLSDGTRRDGSGYVEGEVHLWTNLAVWEIETPSGKADFDTGWADVERRLAEFVGCRLISIELNAPRVVFRFVGGSRQCLLTVGPDANAEESDEQFSLHLTDGRVLTCDQAGKLILGLGSDLA
jgi:hypothetical protein